MIAALLAALLPSTPAAVVALPTAAAVVQDDPQARRPAPDPEAVAAAVRELDQAFAEGTPKERVQAIQRHSELVAPEVVERIAGGLYDASKEVRLAAIGALRWMDHPDALAALEKLYTRDKELREDEELLVPLIKAIGQHGSAGSLPLLGKLSTKEPTQQVVRAHVLGHAWIRQPDAVDSLFALMRKLDRKRLQTHMEDFRLALVILTGDDHGGRSPEEWSAWWKANRKGFEVAAEPPRLPAPMQQTWNRYWDLPVEYERPTRRRERGGD